MERIDIGKGHYLTPIFHVCVPGAAESLLGFYWEHPHMRTGAPCAGVARVCIEHKRTESKEKWKLEGNLDLTPSLLCEKCQEHGFVRNGRWSGVGSPVFNRILDEIDERIRKVDERIKHLGSEGRFPISQMHLQWQRPRA